MTLHDVIRFLVRGSFFPSEEQQRAALLAVDAHEKGFPDAETYQVELDKQAAVAARAANPDAPETDAEKANRLERENVRLQALVAAQTRGASVPPA